ncbi:MAG TPA: 5-methyltetrahydropteroyltriglutamate--homocysteine S-methyltransferase, partial [Acidimicrobiia bacterium]
FAPLRFVPEDKTVVLGLVTSKRPELESEEELLQRIEEASSHFKGGQLCLSPQCGFASTIEGNALTEDEQWAKLSVVVSTAERAWG